MGRADAARLHVRHQGPRPDDRPADRDEAAAEGDPRGAAGRRSRPRRGSTPRTCPAELLDAVWDDVPRRPRAARGARPARLDPAPVPALVLPLVREPGAIEEAVERLDGLAVRGRVPQRVVVQREERRADAPLPRRARASRSSWSTSRRASRARVPPVVAVTSPELAVVRFHGRERRDLGGEGHHPGRALPLPLLARRARRSGCRGSARRRPRRRRST